MTNTKRAWSDVPDHVIVRMRNTEHGMDLGAAAEQHNQLGEAILEALKVNPDPFEKWYSNNWNQGKAPLLGKDYMRAAFKAGQEAGEKIHENH